MGKLILGAGAIVLLLGAFFLPSRVLGAQIEKRLSDIGGNNVNTKTPTRGVRNNNPMSLSYVPSINWQGQTGNDGRYAVFDTALNGIRAGMINLHTMFTRDNLNTVRQIISRWAPSSENPTENYINFVAESIGQNPDTELNWQEDVIPLSRAIVEFENGYQPYDATLYTSAKTATGR